MLEVENVSKSFGSVQVLDSISLTVPEGQTTVLIGPSGCGKSTLLRLLVGLLQPDTGRVIFDGVPLLPENLLSLRRKMGYVLQDGGLFPHLSGLDNVALMPRCLGWSEGQIRERVETLAAMTRLPVEVLDQFPSQLSGGQRQRVAIIRGLMLDPAVLLLDEPMGALDPLIRFDLQEDLREVFRELKKTVVLVTHDMGEAGFLGDQVALLGEGRIVQRGAFESLIESPADEFVSRFVSAQRRSF